MVKRELKEAYEKLIKKRELYGKRPSLGNSLIGLGFLIFVFSLLPLIPIILSELLLRIFGVIVDIIPLVFGGAAFGLILVWIGIKVNKKIPAPPSLSPAEEEFLNVYETLENLDTYLNEKVEFSKNEAIKKLSKVERRIYEPSSTSGSLWKELTKDRDEGLHLLKQNLKERLLPTINQGGIEETEKTYPIIEKFAEYLLNPTTLTVKKLNESISKLPSPHVEVTPLIPFFRRHPKLRYAGIEFIFGLVSVTAYYTGTNFLNLSLDITYPLAWSIWIGLTVGYWAIEKRKG